MAKQSGIGSLLFVDSADVSGDIGAIGTLETSIATQDAPAINQPAMDRLILRRDGSIGFNAYWNTAAGQAHEILSALPRTDRLVSVFIGGDLGDAAASMVAKQIGYSPTLGDDGSLGAAVACDANGFGLEWGEMLTTAAQSFSTGTVNGTSIDFGAASSAFGAAAYLHVFSVASGTAVFAVQDSADNSTFADIAGLVFTGATGATTQRLQTAAGATIRQYVRVQGRGTHGAAVVAVNFVRYSEVGPV